MSRSASAAPRSPATVLKRTKRSVVLPGSKTLARVYWVMSWVTVKVPNAPDPLACIRRSGITSRSKLASFSRYHTSCSSIGPRLPAVRESWLLGTGAPKLVVSLSCASGMVVTLLLRQAVQTPRSWTSTDSTLPRDAVPRGARTASRSSSSTSRISPQRVQT